MLGRRALGMVGVVVLRVGVALGGREAATQPADLRAAFEAAVPREASSLAQAIGHLQGAYAETMTGYAPPREGTKASTKPVKVVRREIRYFVNSDVGGQKVVCTSVPDDGHTSVGGVNMEYRFDVYRKSPKDRWRLEEYKPAPEVNACLNYRWLRVAEDVNGVPLAEMVSGKHGKLAAVTAVEVDGKNLVRADFEFQFSDVRDKTYLCQVTVDPQNHWAITEVEQVYTWGVSRTRIEYQKGVAGMAFPKHYEHRDLDRLGNPGIVHEIEYAAPQPCAAPAETFSLEAFGVDPPAPKGGP